MCVSQMGVRFEFEDIIQNIKCQEYEMSIGQVDGSHGKQDGIGIEISER